MILVKMTHVRAAKMCSRGSRDFCERYGIDWINFLENGLPIEAFDGIEDHMLEQVLIIARAEAELEVTHG